MRLAHKRDDNPIDIARDLAQALRDVLHELNLDDPGDHESWNAPRLARAERHAESALRLLTELK